MTAFTSHGSPPPGTLPEPAETLFEPALDPASPPDELVCPPLPPWLAPGLHWQTPTLSPLGPHVEVPGLPSAHAQATWARGWQGPASTLP